MDIHQTSKKISENRWKWAISLKGKKEELDSIEKVIYHLHPTFKKPVVEKTNRSRNFKIEASGWGTFVVRIEIVYKNGEIDERRHRLVFHQDKPKVFISSLSNQDETDLVEQIKEEADQLGWEVTSSDDVDPGEDLELEVSKKIDESQLFVMISGNSPSRWALNEFETAKQLGKKTLIYDKKDFYGLDDNNKVKNSDDLLNAIKAYNFEIKGL